MKLVLVADTFLPTRSSGAVQLRDLAREFASQGHDLTVMLPDSSMTDNWQLDNMDGFQVLRLKTFKIKEVGYIRRTLAELLMPFLMRKHLRKSPVDVTGYHGVVWYSPSIFYAPLIKHIKKMSSCKGYLIVRDIFPEWAVDIGLMNTGISYRVFKMVANQQYTMADIIGVQTPSNLKYFHYWRTKDTNKLEVLSNWLSHPGQVPSPIRIEETALHGRKIFVYAGNIGVAQGVDILLDLAALCLPRQDIGFLLVGSGSEVARLRTRAKKMQLTNTLFYDEIHPDQIPDLYSQCDIGVVTLDYRHKSHNIPGKFLSYMQSGLPVLANLNKGNDLATLIRDQDVGLACESNNVNDLYGMVDKLLSLIKQDTAVKNRCFDLLNNEFSADAAVKQIVKALVA